MKILCITTVYEDKRKLCETLCLNTCRPRRETYSANPNHKMGVLKMVSIGLANHKPPPPLFFSSFTIIILSLIHIFRYLRNETALHCLCERLTNTTYCCRRIPEYYMTSLTPTQFPSSRSKSLQMQKYFPLYHLIGKQASPRLVKQSTQ